MNKDNKKLVVETLFIKEALKKNLSLNEFLLLLYFDNSYDLVFDIKVVAKILNMNEEDVLLSYGSLMNKKLIEVKAEKDGYGKIIERVSLDNFYNDIKIDYKNKEKVEEKEDIFSIFEEKFGRTLNNMDFEVINAWISNGFSEKLIIKALEEANYNGVCSLRYIDKILYEWNRKGIKAPEDIKKNIEVSMETANIDPKLFDFDWLNETK